MKKTYIIPAARIVTVRPCHLIADSTFTTINTSETIESNDDIGVKSSSASYNVWDDDWSD